MLSWLGSASLYGVMEPMSAWYQQETNHDTLFEMLEKAQGGNCAALNGSCGSSIFLLLSITQLFLRRGGSYRV
jgi:hypothetical protein